MELARIDRDALVGFDGHRVALPDDAEAVGFAPGTATAAVVRSTGEVLRLRGGGLVPSHRVRLVAPPGSGLAVSATGEVMLANVRGTVSVLRQRPSEPVAGWTVVLERPPRARRLALMVSETGLACAVAFRMLDGWGASGLRIIEESRSPIERADVEHRGLEGLQWFESGPVVIYRCGDEATAEWLDVARRRVWEVPFDSDVVQGSLTPCGSALSAVLADGTLWLADRRTKRVRQLAAHVTAAHVRTPNRVRWLDRDGSIREQVLLPGIPLELEPLLGDDPEGRRVLVDWALAHAPPALARALAGRRGWK